MKELYRRNGIYQVSFYVRDRKGNLVRRRKTTGTRDHAAAQRIARNLLVHLTNDAVDPHRPREIPISAAFDLLIAASKHRAAKTKMQYDLVRRKVLGLGLSRESGKLHFIQPSTPLSDLTTSVLHLT
ncbi:hypothetical protein E4L95_16605 [Paracoccus liaowanqingii]|uniref:Uncharacterized protein n=1 Tax=Paracoccus liaowanqingii TaxID=2560053 RepID=A0A4Z1C0B3_9RHOB|nr:hypothetical protein [Paracoccus liaowanqingii]TGN51829.1 hypothetical protein E4L95_16605 [Paracoccus liaowanqingii]